MAASGHFSPDLGVANGSPARAFRLGAGEAISRAYADLTGQPLDASLLALTDVRGRYSHYDLASYARPLAVGLRIPARARQVLFQLPEGLVPAWYVELNTRVQGSSQDSAYYAYVVAAEDGRVLFRNDLTADATHAYRVWADATPPYTPFAGPGGNDSVPHPTGSPSGYVPAFAERNLVTLDSAPYSRNDPWLPPGATETVGNNVDAYADLAAGDGFGPGDVRAPLSGPGAFDFPYSFGLLPYETADQLHASITQLFYLNNWLHDWYYDAGFDEAAGNAQADNYGRGGVGGDPVLAQAQDYSGFNNANMATPADGASPRMQMYLFTGTVDARLTVSAPEELAHDFMASHAAFGPRIFSATGQVVQARDASVAGSPSATDACSALTNAAEVAGKLALVDRGTCNFDLKVLNAQAAGALGVIVVNTSGGSLLPMGGGESTTPTIGAIMIGNVEGNLLKARLASGVQAAIRSRPVAELDGTIDNGIVAHEWGHYISNRLVHDGSGLGNNQGRSMGEGWADFHALLMTVRPEDASVASNPDWTGTFAPAEYATRNLGPDSAYFGIRRLPYSVDFTKNPLTFKHITNGTPLPSGVPYAFGADGLNNAEVHNAGEVWATMLWECYVSLLRAHPFAEAQQRMKSYLVASYRLTPASPTFLEARDALLAVVYAADPEDFQRFAGAFARRGAGVGAVAPERGSATHAGVVESFKAGPDVEWVGATLVDDDPTFGCDGDGYLDNRERGTLRFTLRNTGTAPLEATTATVSVDSAALRLDGDGEVGFPTIGIFESATVEVPVALEGAAPGSTVRFTIAYRDAHGVAAGDRQEVFAVTVEQDERPRASATESVQAQQLPWERTGALGGTRFGVREYAAPERGFHGVDPDAGADFSLVSPPLHVGEGTFSFTFQHMYAFEQAVTSYFDGGVLELSEDDGLTWTDLGNRFTQNGYRGELTPYEGNVNPLRGRRAFRGSSPGYPRLHASTVNLGTAYAGKTVRIRFRIGADEAGGGFGWLVDDIAFTGLTDTPFTTLGANEGVCSGGRPTAGAGEDVSIDEGAPVRLGGSGAGVSG
ncbi:myxosortase-dependent M36 family metallopeptidase, partial [Pyxidicoccus sp. 3LG]